MGSTEAPPPHEGQEWVPVLQLSQCSGEPPNLLLLTPRQRLSRCPARALTWLPWPMESGTEVLGMLWGRKKTTNLFLLTSFMEVLLDGGQERHSQLRLLKEGPHRHTHARTR